MNKSDDILLDLLRVAVGSRPVGRDLAEVTAGAWREVVEMSFRQGVAAVAVDGYQKMVSDGSAVSGGSGLKTVLDSEEMEDLRYEWFGSVLQAEVGYGRHSAAIASLARAYEKAGVEMMVLKGYGLSLDWPVPSHRPVGDIDVYLFGKWREGDAFMASRGVSVDYGHHHHSVFRWKEQIVENHYDIVNRYADRDGRAVDDLLKGLASQGRREVFVDGARVFLPGATFNGVFLLRHSAAHFAGDHITLRHLLDWAMFVDKFWREIDWVLVVEWARRMGQLRFLMCLNALSVDVLGVPEEKFAGVSLGSGLDREVSLEGLSELEGRVLEDILRPTSGERQGLGTGLRGSGKGLRAGSVRTFFFMLRRLRANRWKRDLVSSEVYVLRMVRLGLSHLIGPRLALYASRSRLC